MTDLSFKNIKITSKLMLLVGGCKNFRSVGNDWMTFDYASNASQLIYSSQNGAGKSTMVEHLPFYTMTGKASSTSNTLDSLVNSTTNKGMECYLIWHFGGTYYKVHRGRKPTIFDIYSLVEDEWVEIPNLPVSNGERQEHLYSLLGLEKATAVNVLENTILLSGQRFKGFSTLPAPERRVLIESLLDLGIFSSLNTETKALRANVIADQKQTFLEVTDANLQVSLVSQKVEHIKENIASLKDSHSLRKQELEKELNDCIADKEVVSQEDTSGLELKEGYSKDKEVLDKELVTLKTDLEKDISDLGEFVVDESDPVLVRLNNNIKALEVDLEEAKTLLEDKRKSVGKEVTDLVDNLKSKINGITETYELESLSLEKEHELKLQAESENLETLTRELGEKKHEYDSLVNHHKDCSDNVISLQHSLDETLEKEFKYRSNIQKLRGALLAAKVNKEQEEGNLEGLSHLGECPTCKQNVSEDYLKSLQDGIKVKINKFQEDVDTYEERINKGLNLIEGLKIGELKNGLHAAEMQRDDVNLSDKHLTDLGYKLEATKLMVESLEGTDPLEKLTQEFQRDKVNLEYQLSQAESKVKESLGELEVNYNHLVKTLPSSKENLLQQVEDRITAMKGDHGNKERLLKSVYENTKENVESKLEYLKKQLEKDLQSLVDNKQSKLDELTKKGSSVSEEIVKLEEGFNTKLEEMNNNFDEMNNKHFCKVVDLKELNKKHDQQTQDIEDYNNLLMLLSDKEGKSDVIRGFMPSINASVNKYLDSLGMFLNISIDSEFNIEMLADDRKGQSISSLSAGQKSKLDLSILLSLRDLAAGKQSVDCSLLVLDEVLEPFSYDSLSEVILMLQDKFSHKNIVLITQRGEEVKDYFDNVKTYGLQGGFTVELENEG